MLQNDLHNRLLRSEKIGGFDSAVAANKVPNFTTVNKFGGGEVQVTERTVWDDMALSDYPFKYTNTPMTIVSSLAGDTGQKVTVQYIELSGVDWIYKNGVVITNGLTPVTIQEADENFVSLGVNAAIMFPYRIINTGTGQSAGTTLGVLTIANGGVTYGKVIDGYNQSQMAFFPIATGYSALVHSIGRSVVGADKATIFTYSATPFQQVRQAKRVAGLISGSTFETFHSPYFFTEKTILEVRAKIDVNSAACNAWFDLYLIKNEELVQLQA